MSQIERHTLFQVVGSLAVAGAERLVLNLLLHHDRSRYHPICVCLQDPKGSYYEERLRAAGIEVHFLGKGSKASWSAFRKLDALFRQYRPAIVHTHLIALSYAYFPMMRYRTPVRVHTVHNLAHKEIGVRVARFVRLLAFRYRIGGVVPVAIAEEVRKTIQQVYGYPDPPLIPNGISTDEYAPDPVGRACWRAENVIEPDAIVITVVGRLTEQKNHALLLRAFARLHSIQPLRLLVVGDGELRQQLEQQAAESGISAKVRFLGLRADVPAILNASDIFVLPSRWEGNPLSVQEAMASGLPVVATTVGGVPELVENGVSGLLVPSEDEAALANALQTLIDHPHLRQQMGEAALIRARQRFDIRITVQQYEQLYETLLTRSRS